MIDKNDWRLRGQDQYLANAQLLLSRFDCSIGEHDHCAFCWEKFSECDEDLHDGYCTLDKYHWVCKSCFADFKNMFAWEVIHEN